MCVVEHVSAAKKPFGMLRVISAEKLLKLYAATHFDCHMTIHLRDEELPENNGCYTLSQGVCAKSEITPETTVWTIQQLATFLFENSTPHVSLMLDDWRGLLGVCQILFPDSLEIPPEYLPCRATI